MMVLRLLEGQGPLYNYGNQWKMTGLLLQETCFIFVSLTHFPLASWLEEVSKGTEIHQHELGFSEKTFTEEVSMLHLESQSYPPALRAWKWFWPWPVVQKKSIRKRQFLVSSLMPSISPNPTKKHVIMHPTVQPHGSWYDCLSWRI